MIEKLALEALKEQRRARRWGIFFKLLGFAYLTFLIVMLFDWGRSRAAEREAHRARRGRRRHRREGQRERGQRDRRAAGARSRTRRRKGWSCGSTPPAAARCRRGSSTTRSGASAGCTRTFRCTRWSRTSAPPAGTTSPSATDKIYVDKASLVGSIGVLMDNFGFVGRNGQARGRAAADHRRREQGVPRSVLAVQSRTRSSTRRPCSARSTSSSSTSSARGAASA